jgi:hypothetical protein
MAPSSTATRRIVAISAAIVAAAIAIPIGVQAAATTVVIKDPNSTDKAQVSNGSLKVGDANGRLSVNARTRPSDAGGTLTADGDENNVFQGDLGSIHGFVLDSGTASAPVTVKVELRDSDCTGCDDALIWQGTVSPGGHVGDFFPIAHNFGNGMLVDVNFAPNTGSGAELIIYSETLPSNF